MIHIDCINDSKTLTDNEVRAMVNAVQKQLDRDFSPIWGVDAKLHFGAQRPGAWLCKFVDEKTGPAGQGYHDLGTKGPVSVIVASTQGTSISGIFSEEILEMLIDPFTQFYALDEKTMRLYVMEVCDPVGSDEYGYKIDGLIVSDFVTPCWFYPNGKDSGMPIDFREHLSKPFTRATNGYVTYADMKKYDSAKGDANFVSDPPDSGDGDGAERTRTPSRLRHRKGAVKGERLRKRSS